MVCIGIDCSIYSGGSISRTECQFNGGGGGSGPPGSFCDDTNCNEFPSPGSGPPLNEELIINNLKDPCAREIFQSIGNASKINSPFETGNSNPLAYIDFASEIYKMFAESKNFNLIISNTEVQGKTGITTSIFNSSNGKKEVHIILSNDYLNKATRLSIARTIIHEMVHGYIIYELNNQNYEFSYHFDENYSKYKTSNRAHHEFMGAYVDMIAFSLKKMGFNF
ncbi:SprT-like domain-containing protein [Anditalea andensis]|uniref:SprT-like domain-containing protein n=1 Tax=Anditalea andensis TaxID=1048983 RepID=A0A074L461_9BACT|nr:SprT-like domain-containing protein [Anditalea andensis]KEO74598.1 hypothetical protein EL17_02685 [Anditalea andensis]